LTARPTRRSCITATAVGNISRFATPNGSPEAGIELSVGSRGDAYDNALAETVIGLFKTEVIYRDGPWRGFEEVEYATLEWVPWYNSQRLLEPLGYVPPAEYEEQYHRAQADRSAAVLN